MNEKANQTKAHWATTEALDATWAGMRERRERSGSRPPATGVDGVTAEGFDRERGRGLAEIARRLTRPGDDGATTAYRFAPLLERSIRSAHNKERKVYTPRIRDQIVLRALHEALTEVMATDDPSSRPPPPRRCARRVITEARLQGRLQVARIDVRDFYPSIPHAPLLADLAALPLEPLARQLLTQILVETPHRPLLCGKGDDALRTQGVPTGVSVASQLAHLYMQSVDAALSRADGVTYIRFVDDILIAADGPARLEEAVAEVHQALDARGLTVHAGKGVTTTFEAGFEFLGFWFEGDRVLVTQPRLDKWLQRLRGIHRKHVVGGLGEAEAFLAALNAEISGHRGRHIPYYSLADNVEVYQEVDARIRRLVGGVLRRSGLTTAAVAGAHDWARRYKRDYDQARARAERMYSPPG